MADFENPIEILKEDEALELMGNQQLGRRSFASRMTSTSTR